MSAPLAAVTVPGARAVELAERHAADFAERAGEHDRANTFVGENFAAMRASGLLTATVPIEFGGLGVESLHDLMVAVSRLARGCAATAIAATMHLGFGWEMARSWRRAEHAAPHSTAARRVAGDGRAANQLAMLLRLLGRRMVVAHAATEPGGGGLAFPATEATRSDGGFVVNGRKTFVTNSEIADAVVVFVRIPDGVGWYRYGVAVVPRGTAGMHVSGNWDALGMRGSGSHDVTFADCAVPEEMVRVGQRIGESFHELWPGVLGINFPLVGAYLGIAEAASTMAIEVAHSRRRKPLGRLLAEWPAAQFEVAEMEVALATARATLGLAGEAIDAAMGRGDADPGPAELDRLVLGFQCAKLAVNRAAAHIVDRAMTLVGGSAYLTGHPLGRLYRDVRAGPFMQPYSPNEAKEFIGRVALGLDPYADLRGARPAPQRSGAGTTAVSPQPSPS